MACGTSSDISPCRTGSNPHWGLMVGVLGLFIPQVLHTGYGGVQRAMSGETLSQVALWTVLAVPFAKILATSLSVGSGGSGGIFGPGMVIGGMLGTAFWRLAHGVLPYMPAQPAPFVIIGMMALFGGIAHAPLAVMMVAEMTGDLSLLAPAMVAVAISTVLVGDETIYRFQLPDRAAAPFHQVRLSFPMLSALRMRDAIREPRAPVRADTLLADVEHRFGQGSDALTVVNEMGKFAGIVSWERIRRVSPERRGQVRVRDVLLRGDVVLARPISLPPHTSVFKVRVGAGSPLAGQTLRDAKLPRKALVVSTVREGETIFPRADTRIEAGDVVTLVADERSAPSRRPPSP